MLTKREITLLVAVLSLSSTSFGSELQTVLNEIVQHRQEILAGDAEVSIKSTKGEMVAISRKWLVRFEGNRIRAELFKPNDQIELIGIGCYAESKVVHFVSSQAGKANQFPWVLSICERKDNEDKTPYRVPQLRWLGSIPTQHLMMQQLSPMTFLDSKDPESESLVKLPDGNLKLNWTSKFRLPSSAIVSGSLPHRIYHLSSSFESSDGKLIREELTNTYSEKEDIPLPIRSEYVSFKGDVERDREVVEVQWRSFDKPLAEETFELSSVEYLPAGTSVSWASNEIPPWGKRIRGVSIIWTGTSFAKIPTPRR